MNELYPMLQEAIITIGGALITLLAAYAVRAISIYTTKLQVEAVKLSNEDQRSLAEVAIARIGSLATTTVTALEQTTAKTLREAVRTGNASPEALKQLSQDALVQIKYNLSGEYLDAIEDVYGDAEEYILNVIEEAVWKLKNTPQAAALE